MMSCVERLALKSPTLPPATTTNCLLLGGVEFAIVDPASPWKPEQEKLLRHLEVLSKAGRTPTAIVLTHHHHDHVGGVNALRNATNLPVLAHPRTAELLSPHIAVDGFLNEGDLLKTGEKSWQVLHTPGHASGHLCFYLEETGEVIAGDMVAGEGTIVLDPPEGDLVSYLASLQRLLDLKSTCLYPAHGAALMDPEGLLKHYIQHRHARTVQVAKAGEKRSSFLPLDLVPEIYPDIPKSVWPIAERQVLCHLQYLVAQGKFENDGPRFKASCGDVHG